MEMPANASWDLNSSLLPASTGPGNVEIKAKARWVFTLVQISFKEMTKKICFALSASKIFQRRSERCRRPIFQQCIIRGVWCALTAGKKRRRLRCALRVDDFQCVNEIEMTEYRYDVKSGAEFVRFCAAERIRLCAARHFGPVVIKGSSVRGPD